MTDQTPSTDRSALPAQVEAALKSAWECIDPYSAAGQPGSYARGYDNGFMAALRQMRANLELEYRLAPEPRGEHQWWMAGDPDCPPELKAPNGELHTLRCKVCGGDSRTIGDICGFKSPEPHELPCTAWDSRCCQLEREVERLRAKLSGEPRAECITTADGECTADKCMHSPKYESGWVIEGVWSPADRPDYWVGSSAWSADPYKALRFANQQSAQQAADLMCDGLNVRICEHEWACSPTTKPCNCGAST